MKKLIWLAIAIFTIYILLIFKAPTLANQIEQLIWIDWFNEKVIELKETFDYMVTKAPSKEEIEAAYSWAKEKVDEAKEKIDDLREKAWEIEDTYNKANDFIDDASEKIDKAREVVNTINEIIGTWTTQSWSIEVSSSWEIN